MPLCCAVRCGGVCRLVSGDSVVLDGITIRNCKGYPLSTADYLMKVYMESGSKLVIRNSRFENISYASLQFIRWVGGGGGHKFITERHTTIVIGHGDMATACMCMCMYVAKQSSSSAA